MTDRVATELSGRERPRMRETLARIGDRCRAKSLEPPSRATVYKLMATIRGLVKAMALARGI